MTDDIEHPAGVGIRLQLAAFSLGVAVASAAWLVGRPTVVAAVVLIAAGLGTLALRVSTVGLDVRGSLERAETNSAIYRDLYENAPTAYLSVAPSGEVKLVNDTACDLLGYTREELTGADVLDLYEPGVEGQHRAATLLGRSREGDEIAPRELRMRRSDGTGFWVSLSVSLETDDRGDVVAMRCMVQDISQRKEAEAQARALVKAKDDFIAAVSHELRTPLTSVVGFASLLANEGTGLSADERHEMIRSVSREATDLAHIVEDLLVVARTDVGALRIRTVPVDLRAQAAQVVESLDPEESRVAELDGDNVRVLGDPARVRQILRNLVSNAHRYGGDTIGIRVANGGGVGLIEVWDDGRGIRAEDTERVFQPYESAHDPGGLAASVGLGLAVSRRLAESMDGELGYERIEGRSVFTLRLPLALSLLGAHGLPEAV